MCDFGSASVCMFVCTPGSCLVIPQDPGSSNPSVCTYEWLSLHLPVCVGSVSRANEVCVSVRACASVSVWVVSRRPTGLGCENVPQPKRRGCEWVQLCVCPRWVGQSDLKDIVICWRQDPSYHAALPTTCHHVHAWSGLSLACTSLVSQLCLCIYIKEEYFCLFSLKADGDFRGQLKQKFKFY